MVEKKAHEKDKKKKLLAIAARPTKIPKRRISQKETKITSPVRGSLTPIELEKSRKAAEKRIANRKKKDRGCKREETFGKNREIAKRQEALRQIEDSRNQPSTAPIKNHGSRRLRKDVRGKNSGWEGGQNHFHLSSAAKKHMHKASPQPVPRNIFTKKKSSQDNTKEWPNYLFCS